MKLKLLLGAGALLAIVAALTARGNGGSVKERLAKLPKAHEAALLTTPLQPGEMAPEFNLPDQYGKRHRLSDLRGKKVVLSFYPQDFTYSCAAVASDFSDFVPQFQEKGAVVFSVSVQPVASKLAMSKEFQIRQALLADPGREATKAYRVLNKDNLAARVTFVIGPDGRIISTDQKVHVKTHSNDILKSLDRPVWAQQSIAAKQRTVQLAN